MPWSAISTNQQSNLDFSSSSLHCSFFSSPFPLLTGCLFSPFQGNQELLTKVMVIRTIRNSFPSNLGSFLLFQNITIFYSAVSTPIFPRFSIPPRHPFYSQKIDLRKARPCNVTSLNVRYFKISLYIPLQPVGLSPS